jgi:hypothetical protein
MIQQQNARFGIGSEAQSRGRCPLAHPFNMDLRVSIRERSNNVRQSGGLCRDAIGRAYRLIVFAQVFQQRRFAAPSRSEKD